MPIRTKKKILYVITKSNYGGAQRYVHELAVAMQKEYEVVVAFGGEGLLKTKLENDGVRTIRINSFQRDISLFKELNTLRELRDLYKNEKPDIVHLNSSKAVALGSLVGRLYRIPHIVNTIHGWPFLEKRNLLWRSIVWTGSWIPVLLSHTVILVSKHDAAQFMPFARKKITVIHTAVPPINFIPRGEARNTLCGASDIATHTSNLWLATNAELTPNKNLFTAIDAVVAYNKKSTHKIFYCIIGDGDLKDQLTAYIEKKNTKDTIALLGYIDNARAYLNAFDAFLLPSKKEGLPYAVLEAGGAGLPVVASRVGGVPEIIDHEKNGLLIDPNDASSITNALHTLAHSPEYRDRLGTALKEKVTEEFSLERMIKETKKLYVLAT